MLLVGLFTLLLKAPLTGKTFFEKNAQRIAQWNPRRRNGNYTEAQFTLHTFEAPMGGTVLHWATWLLRRADHGSYHWLFDVHRAFIRLAPWSAETWHSVPTNNISVSASAIMRATDWRKLNAAKKGSTLWQYRQNLIYGFARAAADFNLWLVSQGRPMVPQRVLTTFQAVKLKKPGYVMHRVTDPARRRDPADPKNDFPWAEFFAELNRLLKNSSSTGLGEDWLDMFKDKNEFKSFIDARLDEGHRRNRAIQNKQLHPAIQKDLASAATQIYTRIMGDVHPKGRGSDFRGQAVEIDLGVQKILALTESLVGAHSAVENGEEYDSEKFWAGFESRLKEALASSVKVTGDLRVEPINLDTVVDTE